jgi:hypothetical protein
MQYSENMSWNREERGFPLPQAIECNRRPKTRP